MHVSILSIASFLGRLMSGKRQLHSIPPSILSSLHFAGTTADESMAGVGSDLIVKKLGMSRYWLLAAASSIFTGAQICAIRIENPHHLWALSGLTGCKYTDMTSPPNSPH